MFQLRDTTRFRLDLAAFCLFGLLPTLATAAWCLHRHWPGAASAEADRLGRLMGLDAKLAVMSHLRPGAILYEGLELRDPETGEALFRCRLMETAWRNETDPSGQSRRVLEIALSQSEWFAGSFDRARRLLQTAMDGSRSLPGADIRLSARDLILRVPGGPLTFPTAEAALASRPDRTRLKILLHPAGCDAPDPIRLAVDRNRQIGDCPDFCGRKPQKWDCPLPPMPFAWELQTGSGSLPCDLLALLGDEIPPLGPECRFSGEVRANQCPDGWQGEVSGRLDDLDLGSLARNVLPHCVAGVGSAAIESLRFRAGRLEEVRASLAVGPGTIDRTFLAVATDALGLAVGDEPAENGRRIPFDRLAFSVALDEEGIRLKGLCDEIAPGILLCQGDKGLVGEPAAAIDATALARAFAPAAAAGVPVRRCPDWR